MMKTRIYIVEAGGVERELPPPVDETSAAFDPDCMVSPPFTIRTATGNRIFAIRTAPGCRLFTVRPAPGQKND